MSVMQVCILLLSVAALSVRAAFTQAGKCPDYVFTNGVDGNKLAGDWYIVQTASNGFNLGDKTCEVKALKATPTAGIAVTVTMADSGKPADLKAEPIASQVGKFEIKQGDKPSVFVNFIDTDEKNYAVVVLCTSDGEKHGHYIEIVSRRRSLEPNFFEKAKAALAAAKLSDALTPNNPDC